MPRLYSARIVLRVLTKTGFTKISQKGSHVKLRTVKHGRILTVIVPMHKQIARGTFKSILKQAEMTEIEFESYL